MKKKSLMKGNMREMSMLIALVIIIVLFTILTKGILLRPMNIANLIITFPAPIILALLLNEVGSSKYKRVVQTITYLPHFLSTVVVGFGIFFFKVWNLVFKQTKSYSEVSCKM